MLRFIKSNIIIGLTVIIFLASPVTADQTNPSQTSTRLIAPYSQEESTKPNNNWNDTNSGKNEDENEKVDEDKEKENNKEDNNKTQQTTVSPDAIAVRVFNNNQYLSPYDWYQNNIRAQRSLQSLIIDGYDAVRDNRTVYVATTNIIETELIPIIVVISFNQDISNETMDIFGQILNNWRFNQNINHDESLCSSGPGQRSSITCQTDKDCPSGQYCNSLKSKTIRDTKRLIQLTSLKKQLAEYYNSYHERYPSLETGTYLPNKTLSAWPSWQQALAIKLGTSLPVDPINKLGPCEGYHPTTCWNEQTKSFATSDSWPDLPTGSLVYQYELINDKNYLLCTNFETNYSNLESLQCNNHFKNSPPVINCPELLRGVTNQPFVGYVNVYDPDGDSINNVIGISMINQSNNWGPLTAVLTNNQQQIKITSPHVDGSGDFIINLQVKDSFNNITSTSCSVSIADYCPNRFDINYVATSGGTISGQTLQSICQGENGQTVTATPSSGYSFINWSDHVEQATRRELNVVKNQTITANFSPNTYTITFNTEPENSNNLEFTSKSVIFNKPVGTLPTLYKNGFTNSWNTDPGGQGTTYTTNTIYKIPNNLDLYSKLDLIYYTLQYQVNPSAPATGSIVGSSTQSIAYGGTGSPVTATPSPGYSFIKWSDGQTNPTRQDDITEDTQIIAYFDVMCGDYTITDIDGNVYSTVPIGDQCWLGENLKVTKFRYGLSIDEGLPTGSGDTTPRYVSAENNQGLLYNHEAVNYRNLNALCPYGTKVPTKEDFGTLLGTLKADGYQGNIQKSLALRSSSWGGNDNYGLAILPIKPYLSQGLNFVWYYPSTTLTDLLTYGYSFSTYSLTGNQEAVHWYFRINASEISFEHDFNISSSKPNFRSVRCLVKHGSDENESFN